MLGSVLGIYNLEGRPIANCGHITHAIQGLGMSTEVLGPDFYVVRDANAGPDIGVRSNGSFAIWGNILEYLGPDGTRAFEGPEQTMQLWQRHGVDLPLHLNGHFGIAINSGNPRRMVVCQDQFPGIVTIYWTIFDGLLIFADRIKLILKLLSVREFPVDTAALRQYLTDSYITAPRTIYRGIRQLASGEYLYACKGAFEIRSNDSWKRQPGRDVDGTAPHLEYKRLLQNALRQWNHFSPGAGYLLSGGLDSSVNVALASTAQEEPLRTFGVKASSFHSDSPYARKVASTFNTEYREYSFNGDEIEDLPLLVWHFENPFYEPGLMLSWAALRLASQHVESVVGGEIADQLFGCCAVPATRRFLARRRFGPAWRYMLAGVTQLSRNTPLRTVHIARRVADRLIGRYDPANWCGRYGFRNSDLISLSRSRLPEEDRYDMVGLPDTDLDALYDFGCTILNRDYALNGILVANGRIGAMLDIPTYTPFCDRAVSNFILGLDAGLRCHPTCGESDGFVYKALHREVAKHLLESDIIDRPKQGGAISPAIHLQSTKKVTEIRTALVRSPFINETFHCPMVSSFFDAPKVNATRILILLTLDVWHYIFRECDYQSAPEFSLSDFLHLRGTV